MTIQFVRQSTDGMTLIYIPLLAWGFTATALYGMGSVVSAALAGRQPFGVATLIALALLGAITLFVAASTGHLVICTVDRRAGRLRLRRYGVMRRTRDERPLSEVTGVRVHMLRRAQHRVELQLRSGERLMLTPYYVVSLGMRALRRLCDELGLEPALIQEQGSGSRR